MRGVQNDGTSLTELFEFSAHTSEDWALQLRNLQTYVRTELKGREFLRACVRLMDFEGRRSLTKGTVIRFTADGVALATIREVCGSVFPLTGREIGATLGQTKEAALAAAGAHVSPKFRDAGAASLAAAGDLKFEG